MPKVSWLVTIGSNMQFLEHFDEGKRTEIFGSKTDLFYI